MTLPNKTPGTMTPCAPDNPLAPRHDMRFYSVTTDRLIINRCRRCGHNQSVIRGKRVYFEDEVAAQVAAATAALREELEQLRATHAPN